MVTRRSHTKSRSGCQQCKRRRVKCDEKPPLCGNCFRRKLDCSLASRPHAPSDIDPIRADPGSLLTLVDETIYLSSRTTFVAPSFPDFNNRGLELMHHYSTTTASTLALRLDMQHVWQVVVPEIGYESPFLLHGVLSLAALHKASLIPSRKEEYYDIAAYYQTLGMQGFRNILENVRNDNWDASFAFSSIIVVCAFSQVARTTDVIEGMFRLFVLIRGLSSSLGPADTHLANTPLAPFSQGIWIVPENTIMQDSDPPLDNSPLPPDVFRALRRLLSFFRTNLPVSSREDYESATVQLRKAAALIAHAGSRPEIGMLLLFPYMVPEKVVSDIHAKNPYSMVLLSYFAIMLGSLEDHFWFIRGWAARLLTAIDNFLGRHPPLWRAASWARRGHKRRSGVK